MYHIYHDQLIIKRTSDFLQRSVNGSVASNIRCGASWVMSTLTNAFLWNFILHKIEFLSFQIVYRLFSPHNNEYLLFTYKNRRRYSRDRARCRFLMQRHTCTTYLEPSWFQRVPPEAVGTTNTGPVLAINANLPFWVVRISIYVRTILWLHYPLGKSRKHWFSWSLLELCLKLFGPGWQEECME